MLTDSKLIYQLMSNVLNDLLDMSRQSNHRDYVWRVRCHYHFKQLEIYCNMIGEFGIQLHLLPDMEEFELVRYSATVAEGYTNMTLTVESSGGPRILPMCDIPSLMVTPLRTTSDLGVLTH